MTREPPPERARTPSTPPPRALTQHPTADARETPHEVRTRSQPTDAEDLDRRTGQRRHSVPRRKEDATDLAIHTVAEYTQQHFGGHLRADYSDMIGEVRVSDPDTPPTPQAINSEEELEQLPAGVVVRSAAGTIACRHETGIGTTFGDERTFAPWNRLELPVTVLWHPTNAEVPPTT
ncbi:hypothetical protein [Curtobacterium flaccumfaciens]|uniref:hypothetical protein n=1 Tax=Curtobacterium flaccumfaciens TaxID=2035 RepID=UPI001ADBBB24|nr:hypothetical protein [Curtobacterium flaccumfaciens]MBO9041492.1 hypothetical protein [Curtobacterium flaccumfaciens pv. flaccumfaciens]MBO9044978.1 hypothetical protein [Curtobacterium flaccumfaciens pv. flaccumfaciens]MBO9057730.1 hypothetical protein [Curtobacterium flaccumfaciens pv. flaccumfaciens]